MPGSMSTITVSGLPAFAAAAASASALAGWSTTSIRSDTLAFSATRRVIACGVTTGEVMCMACTPSSPSASASPSLAQQTPSAPAAI